MNSVAATGQDARQPELFRQIVEDSDLGLLVTDLEGTIVYVNPRQCEASGYTREELVGANARIFQSELTPVSAYREMWATILAGGAWQGDMLNRRKNGELVWEHLRISPLRNEGGDIVQFLAVKDEQLAKNRTGSADARRTSLDGLTGLPNRAALVERVGNLISQAHAGNTGFTLLSLDIDRFRYCNETLGQIAADQVLVDLVSRLTGAIRDEDLLARVGGDEFVLVLRGTIEDAVCREAADRILETLSRPFHVDARTFELTCSIGLVRYPLDAKDAEGLLRNADLAQLEAKQEGGNRCQFYLPEMHRQTGSRLDMTTQLRHVVENGELRLHYQPQVSLLSGEIVGVEALIRWQHPDRGLVPPGVFIPVAEETGLIIAISEWVIHEACRQAKAWQEAKLPSLRMGVNLSARHFRYGNLPETVASALATSCLEPRYLELELTESAMMQDASKAIRIVDRLKNLGLRISLDDFGTGYSSLAYLSRFAIDCLKIDQSFVRDITSNPVNASIATATIAMAHKLGKTVIAEGVETEAQMQFLRRHDCDEMQGYFYSRPVAADELAEMLASGRRLEFGTAGVADADRSLLLVDDEPNILNALRRLFRREGYRILTATGGAEALELLAVNPVQVIVSDQRMPEMAGVEFLSKVKELYPQTVRIVLSGYSEISTVTDAINKGAIWKYITKPWDDATLRQEIRAAFRLMRPD